MHLLLVAMHLAFSSIAYKSNATPSPLRVRAVTAQHPHSIRYKKNPHVFRNQPGKPKKKHMFLGPNGSIWLHLAPCGSLKTHKDGLRPEEHGTSDPVPARRRSGLRPRRPFHLGEVHRMALVMAAPKQMDVRVVP